MKKFLQEFREFAMHGNVLDMAVGVVIGLYPANKASKLKPIDALHYD